MRRSPFVACGEFSPTKPTTTLHALAEPEGETALSLQSSAWETSSNPPRFPIRNDAGGQLTFAFPASGSINYLYNSRPPQEIGGSLVIGIQVNTSGPVVFSHMTTPDNNCPRSAAARPFLWANRNGDGEFDRWWSNPIAFDLAAGSSVLEVRLAPDQWSSLFGKVGTASGAALAGFDKAIRNVSRLGLTFGGGCYFGHGVFVQGGQAQFVLTSYRIQRFSPAATAN